ncbi:MAG: hypothetical protein MJ252_07120 [archaeon]|nr:hypothetical protein [archaeon]
MSKESDKEVKDNDKISRPLIQVQTHRIGSKTAPAETDVNIFLFIFLV